MHVLVDADSLVWKASAAVEKKTWWALVHDEQGSSWVSFPGMMLRQVNEAVKNFPDTVLEQRTVEEPVENALQIAKSRVTKIYNRLEELTQEPIDSFILILSPAGKTCFRYEVAQTVPYKSKRPPGKPKHWQAVRDYLVQQWGARICEDQLEADDALGIMSTSQEYLNKSIIASIDKDMLTVPGWHYNYDTDHLRKLDDFESIRYLVRQVLTGDAADSIPGLKNVGRITAKKLIDQWHSDIDHIVAVPLYRIALLDKARDYYRECGYSDEYFDEMLDLVTILTTPKIYKVQDGSYTEI